MRRLLGGALVLLVATGTARAGDPYARARARMIRAVQADVTATRARIGRDRLAPAVMEALARVPRHEFVPPEWKDRAYENRPLPIGYGQTISQPYIVALMTDLAGVGLGDRVLEVGTGSGYQAAVLAALGCRVFTVEIIPALAEAARRRLRRLGYDRVRVRLGDGYYGWPEHAPFDAILVTAAADHVPPPLVRQLRPGGRMVIPVGGAFRVQTLTVVEKAADGRVSSREVLPVRFVPLTGGARP